MTPCALTFLLAFYPVPGCFLADAVPSPAKPETSIAAYGRTDPQCGEWTDGCVVCVAPGDHPQCSTPGIACTPTAPNCTRRSGP